jgi:hypothetical protein
VTRASSPNHGSHGDRRWAGCPHSTGVVPIGIGPFASVIVPSASVHWIFTSGSRLGVLWDRRVGGENRRQETPVTKARTNNAFGCLQIANALVWAATIPGATVVAKASDNFIYVPARAAGRYVDDFDCDQRCRPPRSRDMTANPSRGVGSVAMSNSSNDHAARCSRLSHAWT